MFKLETQSASLEISQSVSIQIFYICKIFNILIFLKMSSYREFLGFKDDDTNKVSCSLSGLCAREKSSR